MKRGAAYWLRWLAALPGAVVSVVIASFLLHWVLYATLSSFVKPYPELPERLLYPFVAAVVFICAGSYIAPEHKLKTAIALFGIWLFMWGGFVFLVLTGSDWFGFQLYIPGGAFGVIMAVAGAVTGLLVARAIEKRYRIARLPG